MTSGKIKELLISKFPNLNNNWIEENDIDGESFQHLDHEVLKNFGITSWGIRQKLLNLKFSPINGVTARDLYSVSNSSKIIIDTSLAILAWTTSKSNY